MLSGRAHVLKPYLFVLPTLALFATFSVVPFFLLLATSLLNWDGIYPSNPFEGLHVYRQVFVGFGNYLEVFTGDPVFWTSFTQAGYVTLLALTFQNALALLLAIAVDRNLPGRGAYRTIFFLPPILSEVVVGLIWFWIYDGNFGIFNEILKALSLGAWTRPWLADPKTALTAVAIIHMWKGFGWGFVIFLAGLQTIPDELYEAALKAGALGGKLTGAGGGGYAIFYCEFKKKHRVAEVLERMGGSLVEFSFVDRGLQTWRVEG